jgi:hypothetical protein
MEEFRNPNKIEPDLPVTGKTPEGHEDNNDPGVIGLKTGDDPIEADMEEGEKIVYGSTFSSKDGDLGDESEDNMDMPSQMKGHGNLYDPTLSSGPSELIEDDEIKAGMHVAGSEEIGMAYGEDRYTEESDENEEQPEQD